MTAPTKQEQPWPGFNPPPPAPEGLTGSDAIIAAVKAGQDAEAPSIAASAIIEGKGDRLRPLGQAGEFGNQRGVPVLRSLGGHKEALVQEDNADQVAVKAARQRLLAPLNVPLTPDQREKLQLFREAPPQLRNKWMNDAAGGRKPDLLLALALGDTMQTNISEEQRAAFREQVARSAKTPADEAFITTMRTRAEQRKVAMKYLDGVIAAHKRASDRSVLEQAGAVEPSIQGMTGKERSQLITEIGGEEYERRLYDR